MSSPTPETENIIPSQTDKLIVLNAGSQLSIKLDGENYPAWRIQFSALLTGFDLFGYVDGSKTCPTPTVVAGATTTANPAVSHWTRQDQLILHGIVSSVTATVVTHLGTVKTSQQAWEILKNNGTQSMAIFLQGIKAISDELSIIDNPLDNTDLVIHTLNGLSSEYKEISAALRSRETPIEFAELHEKLMDFETLMQRDNSSPQEPTVVTANTANRSKSQYQAKGPNRNQSTGGQNSDRGVVCQYCEKPGHSAKICYKIKGYPNRNQMRRSANVAAYRHQNPVHNNNWIMDTGASHHITQDLQQLTLAQPYPGSDQVLVGDGTGFEVGPSTTPRTS
ncbi:hypothetical protein TSUD_321860 [Trifolium subterraneum]|uniref:Retrotransposon Copia-like N-terminal domain-containing protein n=1 Tax=Trifolium subterraneum TaxID=3900 RepID=A0A2Z6P1N0_TRISU|nr:hypothetical protein TSUD_321860 [Trifolium subterraneum]